MSTSIEEPSSWVWLEAILALEYLHKSLVCDPPLEILHEVHLLDQVNPLEDGLDPEKWHHLLSPGALEQSNTVKSDPCFWLAR